jgi:primosomal protein N' (replication factor Y)
MAFFEGKSRTVDTPAVEMEDEDVKVLELLDPETYHVLAALHRSKRKGLAESVLRKRANVQDNLLEEMINRAG